MIQNKKIKTQDTSPQFCKCQQWKDACAIGSYVFEDTWFETMRSGHIVNMKDPYRLPPHPKSTFVQLDEGVKCLIKSAL